MKPCALAIGGLDPSGGAGILADARAFEVAGAFACAVAATLTVQSSRRLVSSHSVSSTLLRAQIVEITAHQDVMAIKIGALGGRANVRAVAHFIAEFTRFARFPVVLDPVILPTHGMARLLAADAIGLTRTKLIPHATLVTANASEAETLTGHRVQSVADAHQAARALVSLGAYAALVKGGHLADRDAVDCLRIGDQAIELRSTRLDIGDVHGTGCTLAALIAGRLAVQKFALITEATEKKQALEKAVRWAKSVHRAMLQGAVRIGDGARVMPSIALVGDALGDTAHDE